MNKKREISRFLDRPYDELTPVRQKAHDILCQFLTEKEIESFRTKKHCIFVNDKNHAIRISRDSSLYYWGQSRCLIICSPFWITEEDHEIKWRKQNKGSVGRKIPVEDRILAMIIQFFSSTEELIYADCSNAENNKIIYDMYGWSSKRDLRYAIKNRKPLPYAVYRPLDK